MGEALARNRRIAFGLCVLVPLGLWSLGLLRAPKFMSDDWIFIVDNRATWLSVWARDSYQAAGFEGAPAVVYRPLGVALLASLRDVLGVGSPLPYRALSVVLHALNAGLMSLWLSRMGLRVVGAVSAAVLWSVMPIHAETLGWAVALFDVASSTVLLSALVLATSARTSLRWAAIGCFALSLLVKESALFGVFALGATLALSVRPLRANRLGWQWATLALVCMGYLVVRHAAGVSPPPELPLAVGPLFASLGEGLARAVGLQVMTAAAGPPLHSPTWLGIAWIVAVFALVVWSVVRAPRVVIPVACLAAIAVGQILFGQSQTGFLVDPDRYFYLTAAIVPVGLVVVSAASWNARLHKVRHPFALASFVGLLAFWSWQASSGLAHYDDFEQVLSREIALGRASGYIHFLRGIERLERGDPCSAAVDFERSAALEADAGRRAQAQQFAARARRNCPSS